MVAFSEKQLFDRLWQAITTDGSGNPALRTVSQGLAANSVNDTHIDWGTGTNQVSAADMPIADAGSYFTGTDVEAALQELGASVAVTGAPADATYIVQVANGTLTNEQALGSLATGLLKNTTTTGVLSIATAGTDYYNPGGTDVAVADGGTGSSTASGARTNLGLVIGTDVQAYNANLAALAGLTSAADKLPYFTGSGTAAVTAFTTFGRSLVDDADAATARTTLGLGTIATQASSSVSITGGSITGITDLAVADGGTGVSTLTGIVKGNGASAFSAATEGTDYWKPGGTDVALADGGTGASTASAARSNLGAAASGANSDITALSAIAAAAGVVLNPYGTLTGNTSEIRFLELAANGSSYVGFKAPDSLAGNVIWTLPTADATSSGQALTSDAAGNLAWATVGGTPTVKILVVGGGGGGGGGASTAHGCGGGGGGGVVETTLTLDARAYTVTVGAAGTGGPSSGSGQGTAGGDSWFDRLIYVHGGGAGAGDTGSTAGSGGCGGGGSNSVHAAGTASVPGVGFNGASGGTGSGQSGGGGGGATAVGSSGSTDVGGAGGAGYTSSISGTSTAYAGGGGGGGNNGNGGGSGGSSIGGAGGNASNGSNATGYGSGGGGSGSWNVAKAGGNGSAGVVIIRYLTADFGTCTGGTKTTDGAYTVHTFTTSGTFTLVAA